jgi:hypothetical protein
MAPVPEGAQRSEDGYYYWDPDNQKWQEIPEDERGASAAGSDGAASADGANGANGAGQITHEELAQVTSEEQLDDRSKPYFQPDPDKYPDDDSDAEGADVLSDEPA